MLIVGACLFSFSGCSPAGTSEIPANPPVTSSSASAKQSTISNPEPENPEIEAKLKETAQPAPENSEYSSIEGVELRTFKSHPKLAKVEKTTGEQEGSMVRVYYTDGAVVQLPGRLIESLSTISSAEILRIAAPGPRRDKRKAPVKQN